MSITSWNNSHNDDDDNNDNDDDDDDNNKIRQYSEFTLITVNIIVRWHITKCLLLKRKLWLKCHICRLIGLNNWLSDYRKVVLNYFFGFLLCVWFMVTKCTYYENISGVTAQLQRSTSTPLRPPDSIPATRDLVPPMLACVDDCHGLKRACIFYLRHWQPSRLTLPLASGDACIWTLSSCGRGRRVCKGPRCRKGVENVQYESVRLLSHSVIFLPRNAMHKRSLCCLPVSVRLSVRPCVRLYVCLSRSFIYAPSRDVCLTSVCLSRTSGITREQRGLGRPKLAKR